MRQLEEVVQQRKVADEARYDEQSRRRLLRTLEKKLNTSFIGALSKFETFFGPLWGHRKDESELTPEQKKWREIWSLCRTEILNNGNNQLRAIQSEVVQYTVTWNKHNLVLPVVPESLED